jgi:putative transposase
LLIDIRTVIVHNRAMPPTLTVTRQLNTAQVASLAETLQRFYAACHAMAATTFEGHMASRVKGHRLVYRDIHKTFGLSAQLAEGARGKVVATHTGRQSRKAPIRAQGAMVFEDRVLAPQGLDGAPTLVWSGQSRVPVLVDMLKLSPRHRDDWWSADLTTANVAVDSDGQTHCDGPVNALRQRFQQKGARSAKRRLQNRWCNELNVAANENHCKAKHLITKAPDTRRDWDLEAWSGLREKATMSKAQRRHQPSWARHPLRTGFKEHAAWAGSLVDWVKPRHLSGRGLPHGLIDRPQRPLLASWRYVGRSFARTIRETCRRADPGPLRFLAGVVDIMVTPATNRFD